MSQQQFFKPRRLGHVNLWVGSLEASQHFYNQVCGLHLDFWEPDLKAAFMGTGHTHHDVAIMEKTDGQARYGRNGFLQLPAGIGYTAGLNHIAWEIETESELVANFEKLHKAGIKTSETVDHQIARSVYMSDPDGNGLEYTIDSVPDWRRVVSGAVDLITEGWDVAASSRSTQCLTNTTPLLLQVETAPVHPVRLAHAVLTTTDMPVMRDFYTGIGGLEIVGSALGGDILWLRGGNPRYPDSLVLVKSDVSSYHHASFELPDDAALETALANLEAAGVPVVKTVDETWKRSFFLSDPDGMQVEYLVRRPVSAEIKSVEHAVYLV